MADKKLNELATASDGAYIYAETSDGAQVRISKADLASVVAQQIHDVSTNQGKVTFGATTSAELASVVAGILPSGTLGVGYYNLSYGRETKIKEVVNDGVVIVSSKNNGTVILKISSDGTSLSVVSGTITYMRLNNSSLVMNNFYIKDGSVYANMKGNGIGWTLVI